jgi:predicted DNA-binding transcriptional regulator YafY
LCGFWGGLFFWSARGLHTPGCMLWVMPTVPHPEDGTLVLRLRPDVARLVLELPGARWRESADGMLLVECPGLSTEKLRMRLLACGAGCEVLAPEGLRGWMARELRTAAGLYEETRDA